MLLNEETLAKMVKYIALAHPSLKRASIPHGQGLPIGTMVLLTTEFRLRNDCQEIVVVGPTWIRRYRLSLPYANSTWEAVGRSLSYSTVPALDRALREMCIEDQGIWTLN